MQPLISVVIPVYKVEKYLDQCVKSVVGQTYRNLEIILVDDGSPDCCPEMCDAWAVKDSRVKVIHKTNGGASDSRNVGICEALGEYLIFVDSDDVIVENMLETLLQTCVDNNALMSMCTLLNFSGEAPSLAPKNGTREILNGKFICEHFFECYAAGPHAKLFHKSLVKGRKFILGRKTGEDAAFNYPIIYNLDSVGYVHSEMYFYREYDESATGSFRLSCLDELDTFQEMLRFYLEKKEFRIFNYIAVEYCARLLANRKKVCTYFPEEVSEIMRLDSLYKEALSLGNLSPCSMIFIRLGSLCPSLFRKIFFARQRKRQRKFKG